MEDGRGKRLLTTSVLGGNRRELVKHNYPSIVIGMARSKITVEERGKGVNLGRALQTERVSREKTQSQIAHEAGLSVDALRRIEQGHVANPGVFTVASIADALGRRLTHFVPPRRRKRQ